MFNMVNEIGNHVCVIENVYYSYFYPVMTVIRTVLNYQMQVTFQTGCNKNSVSLYSTFKKFNECFHYTTQQKSCPCTNDESYYMTHIPFCSGVRSHRGRF